jgi:hypothetical protein
MREFWLLTNFRSLAADETLLLNLRPSRTVSSPRKYAIPRGNPTLEQTVYWLGWNAIGFSCGSLLNILIMAWTAPAARIGRHIFKELHTYM